MQTRSSMEGPRCWVQAPRWCCFLQRCLPWACVPRPATTGAMLSTSEAPTPHVMYITRFLAAATRGSSGAAAQ